MKISVNYNRREKPEKSNYVEIHYSEVGELDDSIATSIKMIDVIDYVENPEKLIAVVIEKMRYGCELIIVGNDALLITQEISNGNYNINEIRSFLYNGRKSISNFEHIRNLLEQHGIEIILVNLDKEQAKYMIVGRKPNV